MASEPKLNELISIVHSNMDSHLGYHLRDESIDSAMLHHELCKDIAVQLCELWLSFNKIVVQAHRLPGGMMKWYELVYVAPSGHDGIIMVPRMEDRAFTCSSLPFDMAINDDAITLEERADVLIQWEARSLANLCWRQGKDKIIGAIINVYQPVFVELNAIDEPRLYRRMGPVQCFAHPESFMLDKTRELGFEPWRDLSRMSV